MDSTDEHNEMRELLRENNKLIKENNEILKKLYHHSIIGFSFRILWIAVLLGVPFALYFYILEPYLNMFGANYESFRQGLGSIPGLQGIDSVLPSLMD